LFQVFLNMFEWDAESVNRDNNTRLRYIALDLTQLDFDTSNFVDMVKDFADDGGERNLYVLLATQEQLISDGYIYQNEDDEEIMRFRKDDTHGLLFTFWSFGTGDTELTGDAADNIPERVVDNEFRIAGRKWQSNTSTRAANFTARRDRNNQAAQEGFVVTRANTRDN